MYADALTHIDRLNYVIGWMCTEMPVGWEEMAEAHECGIDIVDVVRNAAQNCR